MSGRRSGRLCPDYDPDRLTRPAVSARVSASSVARFHVVSGMQEPDGHEPDLGRSKGLNFARFRGIILKRGISYAWTSSGAHRGRQVACVLDTEALFASPRRRKLGDLLHSCSRYAAPAAGTGKVDAGISAIRAWSVWAAELPASGRRQCHLRRCTCGEHSRMMESWYPAGSKNAVQRAKFPPFWWHNT